MALSSYPTPADAGVLCIILANAAISISIFKEIVRSVLDVIGIHVAPWDEFSVEPSNDSPKCRRSPTETYMEEFRNRTPAIFMCDSCPEQECSICLTKFGPNTEINRLLVVPQVVPRKVVNILEHNIPPLSGLLDTSRNGRI